MFVQSMSEKKGKIIYHDDTICKTTTKGVHLHSSDMMIIVGITTGICFN